MPARARFPSAAGFVPDSASVPVLAAAASDCHGCDLYENATQTVFGAGLPVARLVLVGEQPGDVEDRRGEPFVGPAGALLDRALAEAGVDRSAIFLTNAVKHFRFTRAGVSATARQTRRRARHCLPAMAGRGADRVRPGWRRRARCHRGADGCSGPASG